MKSMQTYLLRQQAGAMVFVALVLSCAIWLTQSLRFVKLIIGRGLSVSIFAEMTLLLLPSFLLIILPIALFFAVLFTYNKFLNDRELVVMRATGLSPIALSLPALLLAGVVTLISYAMSLYLLPVSFRQFKDMELAARSDFSAVLLQEGVFNTAADNVMIYIRERRSSGELLGILIQDNRNKASPVTMMAERGALVKSEAGPRVMLFNGNRQEVERDTGRLSLLYFERHSFEFGNLSKRTGTRWRDPNERFVWDLLNPGDSRNDRYYAKKLMAEGHNRLASPLLPLAFALIAVATLVSGRFDRRGQTRQLMVAAALGVALQSAAVGLVNLTAKVPAMAPLIYLNALAPVVIGLYVLMHSPRARQRLLGLEPARKAE